MDMEENAGQKEPALRIVEPGVTARDTSTSASSMLNVALDLRVAASCVRRVMQTDTPVEVASKRKCVLCSRRLLHMFSVVHRS